MATFCFNFCICYLIPVSYISIVEDVLKLDFKLETEAKQLLQQQNEFPRALFLGYGNMFTFIRPVETLTHIRASKVVLLHTGRFIVNNLTLIALISMVWSTNLKRKVALTSLALAVWISGILSLILLISHFYNLRSKTFRRSSVTGDGMTMTSTHPNAGIALVNSGMAMATSSSLPSTASTELEPVCCKKQQKKFLTSYWFVE